MLRSLAQMAMGLPYFIARHLGFEAGQVVSVTTNTATRSPRWAGC